MYLYTQACVKFLRQKRFMSGKKKKFKRFWIKSRVLTLTCWRLEVQGQGVTLTPFLLRPLSLPKDCGVFNLRHHVVLPVCLCPNILFFYSINIDTKVPI